jgi:flagella basal body P-ring formation protein FlgA
MSRRSALVGLLAGLALLALLMVPTLARALEPTALKHAPSVDGETILLSDLFNGVAPEADVLVARAPAPGATLSLEPEALQRIARRNGLEWANVEGLRRVVVRRNSQPVSSDAIASLIADALAARDHTAYIVTLASSQQLHAPVDVALGPTVISLSLDALTNSFAAELALSPEMEPVRVTGRAELSVSLPVLARAVARGEAIGAGDISYIETPASRAPADAVFDIRAIVGLSARRALRAGVALKPHDLERPAVIAKGDIVVVRFESGALALSARARALDDVALGDQARFVNLQSNRVIDAIASGPGEAWLLASAPIRIGSVGGQP